jgi:hypothetical protein
MQNRVIPSFVFDKYYKRYSKKFPSLQSDLEKLEAELIENPKLGSDLGNNLYKIRLAVKSKNKGKSGGFRVITYLLSENNENFDIHLLIIYDKSEISDIPKKDLIAIVTEIMKK